MNIPYQETARDLLTRISIHEKYGQHDLDDWTVKVLDPKPGMHILDVGCGAGKQCFLYRDWTNRQATVIGGDVSAELLDKAKSRNLERGDAVEFRSLNFDAALPFEDGAFDVVSSAFAIYYARDLKYTFGEAHRVLKMGGRLFVSGPLPENKRVFYDIIKEATSKPIPPMPGSARFRGEIFETIRSKFAQTELLTFENPLTFPTAQPFMDYVRASLSEDRKLWTSLFAGAAEYERLIADIQRVADSRIAQEGRIVMTKVVGGILAIK